MEEGFAVKAASRNYDHVAEFNIDGRIVDAFRDKGELRSFRRRLQERYTMAVRLNHTIVAARDKEAAALFLTEILGLPTPTLLGPFAVVKVGEDTSLDYMHTDSEIVSQHYAFLVSEAEFDDIFERIRQRQITYWADPGHKEPGKINTWDDGRGLYFDDPNGHLLEIITRPYGGGGTAVSKPHPLVARHLNPSRDF